MVVTPTTVCGVRAHWMLRQLTQPHATAHANSSGHPVIRSFEPGEDWFWNYRTNEYVEGPRLAPPEHHPLDQPVPGPAGQVPANWQDLLVTVTTTWAPARSGRSAVRPGTGPQPPATLDSSLTIQTRSLLHHVLRSKSAPSKEAATRNRTRKSHQCATLRSSRVITETYLLPYGWPAATTLPSDAYSSTTEEVASDQLKRASSPRRRFGRTGPGRESLQYPVSTALCLSSRRSRPLERRTVPLWLVAM